MPNGTRTEVHALAWGGAHARWLTGDVDRRPGSPRRGARRGPRPGPSVLARRRARVCGGDRPAGGRHRADGTGAGRAEGAVRPLCVRLLRRLGCGARRVAPGWGSGPAACPARRRLPHERRVPHPHAVLAVAGRRPAPTSRGARRERSGARRGADVRRGQHRRLVAPPRSSGAERRWRTTSPRSRAWSRRWSSPRHRGAWCCSLAAVPTSPSGPAARAFRLRRSDGTNPRTHTLPSVVDHFLARKASEMTTTSAPPGDTGPGSVRRPGRQSARLPVPGPGTTTTTEPARSTTR